MRLKKLQLILCMSISALVLMGCNLSTPLEAETKTVVVTRLPQIPQNLKTPCADLQRLESGNGAEVLKVMADDRMKYAECRLKNELLIKLFEEEKALN